MTTAIKQTLRDSWVARWTALIIVSFTMMWGYFLTDAMSPLMDMLGISIEQGGMGWSASDFGNSTFHKGICFYRVQKDSPTDIYHQKEHIKITYIIKTF